MDGYATKWQKCSEKQYFGIYNALENPSVWSSYTNADGSYDGITSYVKILTTWGDSVRELIKSVGIAPLPEVEKKWNYWVATEWEEQ